MAAEAKLAAEAAPGDNDAETLATKLIGYVEAIADGRVHGWAWDRSYPHDRIEVRVVSGDRELLEVKADQLRPDLLTNGIGDGRHAFELILPEGVKPTDISIVAVGRTDRLVLEVPQSAATPELALTSLQTSVGQVMEAQRFILRSMQTVLNVVRESSKRPAGEDESATLSEARATLKAQLDGIEMFAIRLDGTLSRLSMQVGEVKPADGEDRRTMLLMSLCAGFSFVAAIAAIVGIFR